LSTLLDTSVIIPYLGSVAYDRLVWSRLVREQVYISSVSSMELLAGSLHPNQRRMADAFIDRLERHDRVVVPSDEEWRRAGLILALYQSRFGHIEPALHIADILITLAGERLGAELVTENGEHFRLWSRFLAQPRRPRLLVVEREAYLNSRQSFSR
jgi:predicted nucleic acid-binding protein